VVLAKAFRALATDSGKNLQPSQTGLGDSDFRELEALLHNVLLIGKTGIEEFCEGRQVLG
jgi:hypothetical protein